MRADFTTSSKDSLRGEPKKRGRGGEGKGSQLSSQSLSPNFSPFPSPFDAPHGGYKKGILCVSEYGVKQIQSTPDNSNPRLLEPRANSNQNRFPLDFRHTFTAILP